jgi:hypothetical protein
VDCLLNADRKNQIDRPATAGKNTHTATQTEKQMKTALFNCRRYSTLAMAQNVASRQHYIVPVLMGDDGKYWVPATTREAGMLVRAGYEAA